MKIKDLIKELKKYNGDTEVAIPSCSDHQVFNPDFNVVKVNAFVSPMSVYPDNNGKQKSVLLN